MSFREALNSASYEFTSILADEILESEYNALALFISMASDSTCPAEKLKYDGAAGTILRQVLERSLKTQEGEPECDEQYEERRGNHAYDAIAKDRSSGY